LIGELELGTSKYTFDEVAADIRLMMPSSQYKYESNSGKQFDIESHFIASSAGEGNDLEPKGMFSPIRRYFKK
jgi:hypothetical protein